MKRNILVIREADYRGKINESNIKDFSLKAFQSFTKADNVFLTEEVGILATKNMMLKDLLHGKIEADEKIPQIEVIAFYHKFPEPHFEVMEITKH